MLNLYSTQGDFYYIGLNGVEIYDQMGRDVLQTMKGSYTTFAEPWSVSSMRGMENDMRMPANLVRQPHATFDDANMWLAPFKNTKSVVAAQGGKQDSNSRVPNFVLFSFDQPVSISAIRLFNYAKTAARGVNEFEILLDSKPVYRGFARQAMS
jgi:hypothetical protein